LKEKAGLAPAFFVAADRCRCLAQKLCAASTIAATQLNTSCSASKVSLQRRFVRGRSIRRRRIASLRLSVQRAPSFNQHFGKVADVTFRQSTDFPP
jgi:hypothetical protein